MSEHPPGKPRIADPLALRVEKLERELATARATLAEHVEENIALHARVIELEATIERAQKILAEGRPLDSPEARLASHLREALGG
jgi:hypothetical protein